MGVINTREAFILKDLIQAKQNIRRDIRDRRRALSERFREEASQGLVKQFRSSQLIQNCKSIALYLPNDGEISPLPLLEYLLSIDMPCYVPVLDPVETTRMRFGQWLPGTPLKPNRFGIEEPVLSTEELCDAASLSVVIAPLVAFDSMGRRLGMGGGFYDRAFADDKTRRSNVRLVGAAYDCQEIKQCPEEEQDQRLSGILTESRFIDLQSDR